MCLKRMLCVILACSLAFGCVGVPARAAEIKVTPTENVSLNFQIPRATSSFRMTIPANKRLAAGTSFPLAAGETVTIKASYYPFSANVDVGLIAPDGNFYYVTVTNGSIDKTIQVNANGNYTLQFRNKSNVDVELSGYVNY